MRITRILVPCGLFLLLSSAVFGQKPLFSLNIRTAGATKSGARVRVMIRLVNTSDHDINVMRVQEADRAEVGLYRISVQDSTGSAPEKTEYGAAIERSNSRPYAPERTASTLRPGEALEDAFRLNDLYNLPPGSYRLQVEQQDPDSKQVVQSNVITFRVVP